MDWKWVGRTAVVAAATAALALAVSLPMAGVADEPQTKEVKVAEAALDNCTVELYAGKLPYMAGEKPELFLKVTGKSDSSDDVEVTVTIMGTRAGSEMSACDSAQGSLDTLAEMSGSPRRDDAIRPPCEHHDAGRQSLQFRMQVGRRRRKRRRRRPAERRLGA